MGKFSASQNVQTVKFSSLNPPEGTDRTHHFLGQRWVHFFAEQIPPQLEKVMKMIETWRYLNLSARRIKVLSPWLCVSDEMKDFDFLIVSSIKEKLLVDLKYSLNRF